mgnify:FL=1
MTPLTAGALKVEFGYEVRVGGFAQVYDYEILKNGVSLYKTDGLWEQGDQREWESEVIRLNEHLSGFPIPELEEMDSAIDLDLDVPAGSFVSWFVRNLREHIKAHPVSEVTDVVEYLEEALF